MCFNWYFQTKTHTGISVTVNGRLARDTKTNIEFTLLGLLSGALKRQDDQTRFRFIQMNEQM